MKNRFLLFLLFSSVSISSQIVIKGTVYQENGPLEGVAVYLNNTMLGTTTNKNGEFSIPVKSGKYDLIISYLGFKKINYSLNTSTYNKPLVFALVEEENMLDEIIVKKTVYDDEWKNNFAVFKIEFLGITELAKDCEILNPEVLHFEYNTKEQILNAFARRPIQIKHKSLGYSIIYELEDFERTKTHVTYLGYSRYKELKGGKRKQKRWKENRLKAYNGSTTHFFKTVLNNKFKEEGFGVNQFKRIPNPKRPSEEEIRIARSIIIANNGIINFSRKIKNPLNALDSALVTIRKKKLPKFVDVIYKTQLSHNEIITFKNATYTFSFDDYLSVFYTKEKEELGYLRRIRKNRKPSVQTSSLIPRNKPIKIDIKGILVNPLALFYEGYWSYEKFADSLPLDYIPILSKQ